MIFVIKTDENPSSQDEFLFERFLKQNFPCIYTHTQIYTHDDRSSSVYKKFFFCSCCTIYKFICISVYIDDTQNKNDY